MQEASWFFLSTYPLPKGREEKSAECAVFCQLFPNPKPQPLFSKGIARHFCRAISVPTSTVQAMECIALDFWLPASKRGDTIMIR